MLFSRNYAALVAVYLGTFLSVIDISIVNLALPTMQIVLDANIASLQWVVNVYAICLASFILSSGLIADRFGRKRAWLIGIIFFTIGSFWCSFSSNITFLLIGRGIQGFAASLLITGAIPILIHIFLDKKKKASVIGFWSATTALGLILGPLLGGILLKYFGWQSIFLINLPFGIIGIILGSFGIKEYKYPKDVKLNIIGQLLSMLTLSLLVYSMTLVGEKGLVNFVSFITLLIAMIAFIFFIIMEKKVAKPLLPLVLFHKKDFILANIASFALGFSYYSCLFFLSIFLQQVQNNTPAATGFRMAPLFIFTACTSILFGRLSLLISIERLACIGYALIAFAMLSMTLFTEYTPYWQIGILFILVGIGSGIAVPSISIIIMNMATSELSSSVSALMNALRQAGMAIGVAFLGALMSIKAIKVLTIYASNLGFNDPLYAANNVIMYHSSLGKLSNLSQFYSLAMGSGFQMAMFFSGLVCLITTILLLVMTKKLK